MKPKQSGKSIFYACVTILCVVVLISGCGGGSTGFAAGTPAVTPSATYNPSPSVQLYFPRGTKTQLSTARAEQTTAAGLVLSSDAEVLLLAGLDSPSPYPGRTDAMMLVFYDRRQAKAAVVSIPPDILVTLPQGEDVRLNTVYALQDMPGLKAVLRDNFGVEVSHYLVMNRDVLSAFVNEFGGVLTRVDDPIVKKCNKLQPGTWVVKGDQFLCLLSLRMGPDEVSRNKRQAQLIRSLFDTLVYNGTLTRMNSLYQEYKDKVSTDLDLFDLITLLPLVLRVGDTGHLEFYALQQNDLQVQVINSNTGATVLSAVEGSLEALFLNAASRIMTPQPQTELLATFEYALTRSPTPTNTPTRTPTATRTKAPTRTLRPTRTRIPTKTRTPTLTLTPTLTATTSLTPSLTPSPSLTPTPSVTLLPTQTPGLTQTPDTTLTSPPAP